MLQLCSLWCQLVWTAACDDSRPLQIALISFHRSTTEPASPVPATFCPIPTNCPRGNGPASFTLWMSSTTFNCVTRHPRVCVCVLPQEMEISVNSGDSLVTHGARLCHINFADVYMLSATCSCNEEWWVVILIELFQGFQLGSTISVACFNYYWSVVQPGNCKESSGYWYRSHTCPFKQQWGYNRVPVGLV